MPAKSKAPPGWPFGLIAPDQPEPYFTARVTDWTLRQLPEELRHQSALHDQPLIALRLLHLQLVGALSGLRAGYRTVPDDFPRLDAVGQGAARNALTVIGRGLSIRLRGVELVAVEMQRRAGYPRRP